MPVRRWPGKASREPEATVWLDFQTCQGVDDAGERVLPATDPSKDVAPVLVLLETAVAAGAVKVMVSGKVPPAADWLLPAKGQSQAAFTPGWLVDDKGHWLGEYPQGRFVQASTGREVNVLVVEQWFPGHGDMAPGAARYCHRLLTQLVADALRRPEWVLSRLPGNAFAEI